MGLGHARTYLKGYLMAIEKTFIMIKPDAVRDRKIGEIVARIERSGLVIERMEMTTLERATVEEHYAHLADKPFFGGLCDFMTSGPVVKIPTPYAGKLSLPAKHGSKAIPLPRSTLCVNAGKLAVIRALLIQSYSGNWPPC